MHFVAAKNFWGKRVARRLVAEITVPKAGSCNKMWQLQLQDLPIIYWAVCSSSLILTTHNNTIAGWLGSSARFRPHFQDALGRGWQGVQRKEVDLAIEGSKFQWIPGGGILTLEIFSSRTERGWRASTGGLGAARRSGEHKPIKGLLFTVDICRSDWGVQYYHVPMPRLSQYHGCYYVFISEPCDYMLSLPWSTMDHRWWFFSSPPWRRRAQSDFILAGKKMLCPRHWLTLRFSRWTLDNWGGLKGWARNPRRQSNLSIFSIQRSTRV